MRKFKRDNPEERTAELKTGTGMINPPFTDRLRVQGTTAGPKQALSGRALLLMSGGGLYKEAEALSPEISPRKLSFPFLVTSFSWMNKDAYDEKKYPYYTQRNSDNIRESFKKITCQSDGEDSLAQVTDNFSNKFPARFINNDHDFIINTGIDVCQGKKILLVAPRNDGAWKKGKKGPGPF